MFEIKTIPSLWNRQETGLQIHTSTSTYTPEIIYNRVAMLSVRPGIMEQWDRLQLRAPTLWRSYCVNQSRYEAAKNSRTLNQDLFHPPEISINCAPLAWNFAIDIVWFASLKSCSNRPIRLLAAFFVVEAATEVFSLKLSIRLLVRSMTALRLR